MSLGTPVDLTDVELFVHDQHHNALAVLRETQPVYWNNTEVGTGFWAITRYADVVDAYRDHKTFGSSRGAVLGGSFGGPDDTAAGRMLVATDLPRHRLIKQQIMPGLSSATTDQVRRQVDALLELEVARLVRDGGGDFTDGIATALPAGALMVIMGIGHTDALDLVGMTRQMVGYREPELLDDRTSERGRLAGLHTDIFAFFADLLESRRRDPRDDLVSLLCRAEVNGRPFADEDILYNCLNLAVGGNETSSHTASSGMAVLVEHPDQWEALMEDRSLLPNAIEEMLRWASVNAYVQRVVTRDTEFAGIPMRTGDSVTLWNVSANRDADQFPAPDSFDIRRSPNRHLSYGAGIHRCIGSSLAQVELSVVFDRLLDAGLRLRVAGPVQRTRSNFILGISQMPVEVVS